MEARRERNERIIHDGEAPDLSLSGSTEDPGEQPDRGNDSGLMGRLRNLFELS
ncbi:hypothetical protein D3C86_2228900 [compost metagenome]